MKVNNNSHQTALAEINITPLVDVILVLLIVFMVTAPLLSQGLDINLPMASAPAIERTDQDVTLTVSKDGGLYLQDDKTPYTLENLDRKIATIFNHREKREIFIRADDGVNYGLVVKTVSLLKKSGIERVGLVTQEETQQGSQN